MQKIREREMKTARSAALVDCQRQKRTDEQRRRTQRRAARSTEERMNETERIEVAAGVMQTYCRQRLQQPTHRERT